MTKTVKLVFSLDVLVYPLLFVLSLWLVFWVEVRFGVNFNRYGIYPLHAEGLIGILTGPFIHSGLEHLFNNSVPLLVLSMGLFYFYRSIRWRVVILGVLLTGLMTWLIGRPAMHIGASGVVYMLTSFLFFKGAFSRHYRLMAIALIVVFLYGGFIWYLFPVDPKISWEGHISGFAVGLVLALLLRPKKPPVARYAWESPNYNPDDDEFMQQFDDDGNFIGDLPKEEQAEEEPIKIIYRFRSRKDDL